MFVCFSDDDIFCWQIRDECGDIDPDLIAVIFHECDYNTQTTIERIKAGDYEVKKSLKSNESIEFVGWRMANSEIE